MELSGILFNIETMRGGAAAQFARRIEKLRYSTLWYGEGVSGREPFVRRERAAEILLPQPARISALKSKDFRLRFVHFL